MKHILQWHEPAGKLAEALGITKHPEQVALIEGIVHRALRENWSMRQLFEYVGELDISDELWANFLYTYGYWDRQRSL